MPFDIVTFTVIHVLLSLVGIFAGLVVVGGLMAGRRLDGWTGIFLLTTVLTNVTGFGFPFPPIIASHYVAILSLVTLPAVLFLVVVHYSQVHQLRTAWERAFAMGALWLACYAVPVLALDPRLRYVLSHWRTEMRFGPRR